MFNHLVKIYNSGNLPNILLFSGKKGIGKCTFAYHFINYIFSLKEDHKYDLENNIINSDNYSFNQVKNDTHLNLFNIYLKNEKKNIEISQVKEMINFTNKSTLNNINRVILIDGVEFLNKSSVNALLKSIEEPNYDILFLLIHDSEKKIIPTLKSRSVNFKFNLTSDTMSEIVNFFYGENICDNISEDFKYNFNSPAFYINFYNFCNNNGIDFSKISIESFLIYVIENGLFKKDEFIKNEIKYFIEIFFKKKIKYLINYNQQNYCYYFNKKFYLVNKFNLDLETYLMEFKEMMLNE